MGVESDVHLTKKYKEVCADLNLDKAAADESWQSFHRIGSQFTLEGEKIHWLACALYVSCRRGITPTVGGGRGSYIEGNCVSLTRLLRSCNLSLVQFFNKMRKWSDMANLPSEMREKVDHLERNFSVTTVIFNKFKPIFSYVFKHPIISPLKPKSRKQAKNVSVTSSEVFSFCWTLFVHVKSQYTAISDDLVNSYHLLLACIDFCYSNALVADNFRELINPSFPELPINFQDTSADFRHLEAVACAVNALCSQFDGISADALGIKEHWWKPFIKRMVERKEVKCRSQLGLLGFFDSANFEFNLKNVNKDYDRFVLNCGDFDERVFLCESADQELGTDSHAAFDNLAQRMSEKFMKQHMEDTKTLAPMTPLSNRHFLNNRDAVRSTPVSSATQTVSQLHSLLLDREDKPGQGLLDIFAECSKNPIDSITARLTEIGEKFVAAYAQPIDQDQAGAENIAALAIQSNEFAKKRLQLAVTLYYKILENIMKRERKRFQVTSNISEGLSNLLNNEVFHISLFCCCCEIVLYSYNSKRTFPWILDVFTDFKDLRFQAFQFYRVIELLIRDEEGLSRSVVKHLNSIEEQVLDHIAWKSNSSLWDAIGAQGVPSCQDVAIPSPSNEGGSTIPPSPYSIVKRFGPNTFASPNSNSAAGDRFSSPVHSSAKRRLFDSGTINGSSESKPVTYVNLQTQTASGEIRVLQLPAITLSSLPSEQPTRMDPPKPKTGATGLFFRKVYNLAWLRAKDLCDRLNITDDDLKRKIWTCFELTLKNHTHLMKDRHIDQLLMCAIYSMCKVTRREITFTDIMKNYRLQPQAKSHVYRSVLLNEASGRRNSNSNTTGHGSSSRSGSTSPSDEQLPPQEPKKEVIRSSSTLPGPSSSSQPATPIRLPGSESHFEFGPRGDLIMFYNHVYVPEMKEFILKFSMTNETPLLSPLPKHVGRQLSPYRRISQSHSVFVSPLKATNFPASPNRPHTYSFQRSPAKELRNINQMMSSVGEKKAVSKRIFQDDDTDPNNKKLCPDPAVMRHKIQNIFNERGGAAGAGGGTGSIS